MCALFDFFPAHKWSQGHGGKGGKEWSFRSRKYLGVLFINEGWMKGLQWCGWCTGVFSEFSSLICDCELWADTKTWEWGYRWTVWASSRVSAVESLKNYCSSTSKGVSIWTEASYTITREVTARCLDRQTNDGWVDDELTWNFMGVGDHWRISREVTEMRIEFLWVLVILWGFLVPDNKHEAVWETGTGTNSSQDLRLRWFHFCVFSACHTLTGTSSEGLCDVHEGIEKYQVTSHTGSDTNAR